MWQKISAQFFAYPKAVRQRLLNPGQIICCQFQSSNKFNKNLVTFQTSGLKSVWKEISANVFCCNPWHRSNSEVNPLNSSKRPSCHGSVRLTAVKLQTLFQTLPGTLHKIPKKKLYIKINSWLSNCTNCDCCCCTVATAAGRSWQQAEITCGDACGFRRSSWCRQNCREAKISSLTSILQSSFDFDFVARSSHIALTQSCLGRLHDLDIVLVAFVKPFDQTNFLMPVYPPWQSICIHASLLRRQLLGLFWKLHANVLKCWWENKDCAYFNTTHSCASVAYRINEHWWLIIESLA